MYDHVARFQKYLLRIKQLGATLVAMSPDSTKEDLIRADHMTGAKYSLLSDENNTVAKQFGVVPSEENELPLPIGFVIDSNGQVMYSFVSDGDLRDRPEPLEMINAIPAERKSCKRRRRFSFPFTS